ncbi:hypothetical protein niasHT_018725 [Heterodera trifolii]|uniref:BTB domain-containing protein n=1 Tax=Heterodera trifolii TaxID=157864 RepID=A0ABD2LBI0_9BILA
MHAHKAILIASSNVFEAMFKTEQKNSNGTNAGKTSANCPVVEVPDVEPAAFKIMLSFIYTDDLNELNGDNAMAVLYAAKNFNIHSLVRPSLQIPISELRIIFLAYAQALLFELEALRWADEKCRQNGIECSSENRRSLLGPALFKIRFPNIHEENFANYVVPSGVLTMEEVLGVYQFNSHPFLYLHGIPGLYSLKFPSHGRIFNWNKAKDNRRGTLALEIEKVSEFAGESVGSRRFRLPDNPTVDNSTVDNPTVGQSDSEDISTEVDNSTVDNPTVGQSDSEDNSTEVDNSTVDNPTGAGSFSRDGVRPGVERSNWREEATFGSLLISLQEFDSSIPYYLGLPIYFVTLSLASPPCSCVNSLLLLVGHATEVRPMMCPPVPNKMCRSVAATVADDLFVCRTCFWGFTNKSIHNLK